MRRCSAGDSYNHGNDKRDVSCPKTTFPRACQESGIGFDGSRVALFVQFPLIWSQPESPLRKEVGAGRHRGDHVRNRPVEPGEWELHGVKHKIVAFAQPPYLVMTLQQMWRGCVVQADWTIWVLREALPRHAERTDV
jgi:hypothetical protein